MRQKKGKLFLSLLCAAALLTTGVSFHSEALADTGDSLLQPVRVYGTVNHAEEGRISITRQDGSFAGQELIITVSEKTRVLDAVNGFPAALNTIQNGETIYAYIGPAMTMSLPPISNGELILCKIPADYRVPEYITVDTLTMNKDGVSGTIVSADGVTYTIPADCRILPYLTRNIVTLGDLTKGRSCLIWLDSTGSTAEKIVAFAKSASENPELTDGPGSTIQKFGWHSESGNWYYYGKDGLQKGWLLDNGCWYYLNPETGIMQTGFLTIDGKTWYLNEDGRMETAPVTFTPNENGELIKS